MMTRRGYFEYEEGAEAVGTNVKDPGAVGGKHMGIWNILQGRDTSHTDTWVGDVGLDAMDGPYPKGLPPQGGPLDD